MRDVFICQASEAVSKAAGGATVGEFLVVLAILVGMGVVFAGITYLVGYLMG